MKLHLSLLAAALLAPALQAQTMPQDIWRYDGLQFSAPVNTNTLGSIAIGSGGVYVEQATPTITIHQYTEGGVSIRSIAHGFTGSPNIAGMACDTAGNLYVLDQVSRMIRKFNSSGDDQGINNWGGMGTTDGLFGTMSGTTLLAIGPDNLIYVADPGNQRVQVFNTAGFFLRKWGQPGALPGQFGIGAPSAVASGPNGWIYAAGGSLIRIFDPLGNFIRSASGNEIPFAVAPDGILLATNVFFDQSLTVIQSMAVGATAAFSPRGDLYSVGSTAVSVFEREYSGVQNSLLPPAIPHPSVITVAQRPATSWLDVDYRVNDADSPTVTTAAAVFTNGGNLLANIIPMKTFVDGTGGNIGTNIGPGVTKRITWDMAADWSADFAQIQVEVMAKDDRNPLGIHWITVPAEGANLAIQVSRAPLTDNNLRSLWFWFLATGNTKFTKANGATSLLGAGTGFAGQTLASDSGSAVVPTSYGLAAAYQEIGVRAITLDETARAQAGSYGFTSVDARSVVRDAAVPSHIVVGWGGQNVIPPVVQVGTVTKVATCPFGSQSMALKSNGTVVAWLSGNVLATVPPGLSGVTDIAVGESHFLAVKAGLVIAWGDNSFGQTTVPGGLSNVVAVAATSNSSLALKSDGTVVAWGSNTVGQVAGATGKTDIASISGGNRHYIARKIDGTLVAWGDNGSGQGTVPALLVGSSVKAVAAGANHNLVIRNDDTVFAWGFNGGAQVSPLPGALAGATIIAIAGGLDHSLAVTSTGTVVAWGSNSTGQGVVPAGLGGVTRVAAGNNFNLAIRTNP